MERQFSYVMLKPGVLQRRLVGEVISRIERKGLCIQAMKLLQLPRPLAEEHYREHRAKPFFKDLVDYITSGPVLAMIVGGDEAVAAMRQLCGATAAAEAQPGTIRGDLALHTRMNVVHASDSVASAEREIGLFFRPEELVNWPDGDGRWI